MTEERKRRPNRYPQELREQALELYFSALAECGIKKQAAEQVCGLLGIGSAETVLAWVKQQEVDAGKRPGMTTEEKEELRKLKRENAELKRANGILRAASAFFAAELDRPQGR
jgi:transposase